MGCGESVMLKQSKRIDQILEVDQQQRKRHVRLLLLGAGESGKSTVAKQMQIIHLNGFSETQKIEIKPIIFHNIVTSIRTLIEQSSNYKVPIENSNIATKILENSWFNGELTPQMGSDIQTLWQDAGIQEAYIHRSDFQLNDSTEYYFENIERISEPNYTPSVGDVLRSRAKTLGISETKFEAGNLKFTLIDVGGQRSERRKWMHCFQDVTAVVFVAALSGYDQKLYEDETTNRMSEALKLFKDICNTQWFADTAMILFLNKKDLFAEKIQRVPLNVCFPDYTGENNYEAASKYIEGQFLKQNQDQKKLIYVHFTCATDTDNITIVFKAVQDIILTNILQQDKVG